MADKNNVQFKDQTSKPDPALKRLDVLLGTWDLTGHTLDADDKTLSGGWRPKQGEQASPENSYAAFMARIKK